MSLDVSGKLEEAQTMPFAPPAFQGLLGAIDSAIAKDYPARGE